MEKARNDIKTEEWVSIRKEAFEDVLDNLYSATLTLECLKASIQASIDKVDKSLGILDPDPGDEADDEAGDEAELGGDPEEDLEDLFSRGGFPAWDPGKTLFSDGGISSFPHIYERPKKRRNRNKRRKRRNR